MSGKHRLTPSEQLMNDAHKTITLLKQMVPSLVRERNHAQADAEHWKSQAMLISHDAMAVASENTALKLRIAFLESQHPAPMIEIRESALVPLEHPDAIGGE